MKKISRIILPVAMALPFMACNKEELTEPVSKGEQISISVKATAEDLANLTDTKTYIDGMNVLWSANEQMSIFLINGNTAASATSTGFTGEGEAEAMFAFNFNSEDIPASGPYTYGGIYPASAVGIIAVCIGGFFGNINWKWLTAIIIGLVVISLCAGFVGLFAPSGAEDIPANVMTGA